VIGLDEMVIGVVAVPDCNTSISLRHYRENREVLRELWNTAVTLVGVKEYYVTYDLKPEWEVI
jgi:hypothetical protein